jgi:hypothetical protein
MRVDRNRRRRSVSPFQLVESPYEDVECPGRRRHIVANQDEPRRHTPGDTRQKLGRSAVVDGHDDDAAEQTPPERYDPFRAVLAPEHHLVTFADASRSESRGEPAGGAANVRVRMASYPEAIVVHQELPPRLREIFEVINQRCPGHISSQGVAGGVVQIRLQRRRRIRVNSGHCVCNHCRGGPYTGTTGSRVLWVSIGLMLIVIVLWAPVQAGFSRATLEESAERACGIFRGSVKFLWRSF